MGLTNNQLKLIAMLSMLFDHIGVILFPACEWLRIVGRLSYPIFAYMIAEGCRHTRNRPRYFAQLAVLAVLCQIVLCVFVGSVKQGILVTFSLSVITVFAVDAFLKNRTVASLSAMIAVLCGVLFAAVLAPILWKDFGYRVEYTVLGVLMPIAIYYAHNKTWRLLFSALFLVAMGLHSGSLQWFGLLALPLLFLYNGKRGRANIKYLFYVFYPSHLVILYLIAKLQAVL